MRMACQKIYALKDPETLHFLPLRDSQAFFSAKAIIRISLKGRQPQDPAHLQPAPFQLYPSIE
jgi:hypothetical protein